MNIRDAAKQLTELSQKYGDFEFMIYDGADYESVTNFDVAGSAVVPIHIPKPQPIADRLISLFDNLKY